MAKLNAAEINLTAQQSLNSGVFRELARVQYPGQRVQLEGGDFLDIQVLQAIRTLTPEIARALEDRGPEMILSLVSGMGHGGAPAVSQTFSDAVRTLNRRLSVVRNFLETDSAAARGLLDFMGGVGVEELCREVSLGAMSVLDR